MAAGSPAGGVEDFVITPKLDDEAAIMADQQTGRSGDFTAYGVLFPTDNLPPIFLPVIVGWREHRPTIADQMCYGECYPYEDTYLILHEDTSIVLINKVYFGGAYLRYQAGTRTELYDDYEDCCTTRRPPGATGPYPMWRYEFGEPREHGHAAGPCPPIIYPGSQYARCASLHYNAYFHNPVFHETAAINYDNFYVNGISYGIEDWSWQWDM